MYDGGGIKYFVWKMQILLVCQYYFDYRGPPRGFWEQGKKGIYFRGIGEQMPNFEGNRGTKTILGNREHKKTNFRFLGNRGTSQFILGEQGNRYPPPPMGGPHYSKSI